MSKTPAFVTATAVAALALATAPLASADEHEPPAPIPPHPHILLVGAEVDFSSEPPVLLDYTRCVDLASNNRLPLNSQHEHMHFGRAGEALAAGGSHFVIPAAPAFDLPWTDCASFLAIFDS